MVWKGENRGVVAALTGGRELDWPARRASLGARGALRPTQGGKRRLVRAVDGGDVNGGRN
jgi:hypothetical protein